MGTGNRRGRASRAAGIVSAVLALACHAPGGVPESDAPPGERQDDLDAWIAYLAPRPDEEAWRRIPWLGSFGDGVLRADAERKPLLLWVMNGHPLGCT